ncbi:MAG: GNAT family N-acetyltransferase [Catenulispora sp.]|nr:GNAT family N-acetyltransferase [Catenulispora sp.]
MDPHSAATESIVSLTPSELVGLREELIAVAAEAFSAPPWNEGPDDAAGLVDGMLGKVERRDFTAVAAFDDGRLAGFAYGHTGSTTAGLHPGPLAPAEAFEVIELAVATAYQGRGIGRMLHNALIAHAPSPRMLLTHHEAPARGAYARWGWTEVASVTTLSGHERVLMQKA